MSAATAAVDNGSNLCVVVLQFAELISYLMLIVCERSDHLFPHEDQCCGRFGMEWLPGSGSSM